MTQKVALYARVSTHDQHTLELQRETLETYASNRHWKIVFRVDDIGSGAKERPQREEIMRAARRREIDAVLVWRLDRWGRSVADLVTTLQELNELDVGFVSLTEALDFTTPSGRAMAGLLAVFAEFEREILRDRVKAGLAQARKKGKSLGHPATVRKHIDQVRQLQIQGLSKSEIARRVGISRTSVRRMVR